MKHLSLWDMSDRELLHVVDEQAMGAGDAFPGWTEPRAVSDAIGLSQKGGSGQRLSWMVRFGLLERHADRAIYRCNRVGRAMMNGDLSPEAAKALKEMDPAQLVTVTSEITRRYGRLGDGAAHVMRREWKRGTERGSR